MARSACFQLQRFLDHRNLATIFHALVTSQVDYYNVVYMELPWETTWKLQMVQNAAASMLMGASRFYHITPLLR